jgi:hypothetical protein
MSAAPAFVFYFAASAKPQQAWCGCWFVGWRTTLAVSRL